jgi:hypothetical protein
MLAYFIVSSKLGTSTKSYPTYDRALQAGVTWFRKNPERVGKFSVEEAGELFCGYCNNVHIGLEKCEFYPCQLCGRYDDCGHDRYEMHAVYLDAIAH